MNSTEKIVKKIDKYELKNEAEKASIRTKLEKAEAQKVEAQKNLDAAIEQNDDAAYHKAKEELRFSMDAIEMCNNKLTALESSVCSREEYEEISKAIAAASIEAEAEATKKVASLAAEIWKVAEELSNTIEENNALMARWCVLASEDASPLHYHNQAASEVHYIGTMFRRRKMAQPEFYSFIKD